MPLLYQRTETEDKVIINYKYIALYWLTIIGTLIYLFASNADSFLRSLTCCVLPICGAMIIIFYLDTKEVNSETRLAMKEGRAKISGKWFYFWSPPIVEISKIKKS